jgi:hypothetical protein
MIEKRGVKKVLVMAMVVEVVKEKGIKNRSSHYDTWAR